MKWQSVFPDEVLQSLIKEALTNNYDIRIAASRHPAGRGISGSDAIQSAPGPERILRRAERTLGSLSWTLPRLTPPALQLSYIVDFWGQYRRATEAARANLLATRVRAPPGGDDAHRLGRDRLLPVASIGFATRLFATDGDCPIRIACASTPSTIKGGEYAITDVYQAKLLVEQAEAEVITLKQSIEQTENQLSILLGRNPGSIPRGLTLVDEPHLDEVPAGLPSAILERRPDVRQAEESLVAANANVGVAKAAFFPQIPLTASFGAQSTALTSFLQGPATFWAWVGSCTAALRWRKNHQPVPPGSGATRRGRADL